MAGRVLQEKIIGLCHPMGIGNGQQETGCDACARILEYLT
jgi:hypothetical protein